MRSAIAGAAVFIVFVIGAFVAAYSGRAGSPSRFRISLFLVYCLAISAAVGLTRRQLFPFHHWPLFEILLPDTVYFGRLMAVDSAGAEHEIDYRAWQPLNVEDVATWAHRQGGFFALDSAAQVRAGLYLLRHVEAARQRAVAGRTIGSNRRVLGPFAAPTFVLFRRVWTDPGSVPKAPFVGLRWVVEGWRPLGPGRSDNFVSRSVRHEVMLRR